MRRLVAVIGCLCALALALAAPAAWAAGEPVASTGNATAITPASATLNGTVNPEGQATTYYFEYGTTTSYGTQTAATSAGSGTADVKASAPIAALTPNTAYHYRLVATNAAGTTLGSDVAFRTPKPPVPVASTRGAVAVTQTSATLRGAVNPEGQATSYVFQYGTSTAYGSETAAADAGAGTKSIAVAAVIAALSQGTTYHYRLVATNVNGTAYGHDSLFRTARPPTGITLAAEADRITFGQATSLSGRVLAPRPSHPSVILQSAPSAAGPWSDAGSTVAAASGAYAFSRLAPSADTFYRVLSDGATSATLRVSVRFRVAIAVGRRHPLRGTEVRFHGHVNPAHRGLRVLVQWRGPRGHWNTIKRARLRGAGPGFSFYSVLVRIQRGGRYRVVVASDRTHAGGESRPVRIRLR